MCSFCLDSIGVPSFNYPQTASLTEQVNLTQHACFILLLSEIFSAPINMQPVTLEMLAET